MAEKKTKPGAINKRPRQFEFPCADLNSPDGFPCSLGADKGSNYSCIKDTMPHFDNLIAHSVILPIPSTMTRQDISNTILGIQIAPEKIAAAGIRNKL